MGSITPIKRLLIANRGEIALRIARAARDEGIVPLGVYSEADRNAAFLDAMEEAAPIGPAQAAESYLRSENILAAARTLHADAVHPGYGFLSERPAFAQAVIDAELLFVGPSPVAMLAMGDKSEAKRRARACNVPVVPGYDGEDQSSILLRAQATLIGTPLLIKATAGGGGRGMRVVRNLLAFEQALEEAKREAFAGFGDDRVLLERYLARPRHIEFQILADAHGNTIHLGERDCSIQRRHQKIIEETPSPVMTSDLRTRMGEAAVRIARSAGYVNAGTVEFLLDKEGSFYFLEMNARLQVEHPITEEAYGIDLVRQQLRIASGKPLAITQASISPRCWSIEARINAEEASYDALPAIGTIGEWSMPSGVGIRIDSGVARGSEVGIHYDSLLAKLIVSAPDRSSAIEQLTSALNATSISGVATNIPVLLAIARNADFRSGATATTFFEEHKDIFTFDALTERRLAFLSALGAIVTDARTWRIGSIGLPITLRCDDATFSVIASRATENDTWRLTGDLTDIVTVKRDGSRIFVNGETPDTGARTHISSDGIDVFRNGTHTRFAFSRPRDVTQIQDSARKAEKSGITSPMPGKITRIAVQAGDVVRERDLLVILEAMKMEHRIEAPYAGTVRAVHVLPETLVVKGACLIDFL
jgi:3-methylcrotonyl-CoA carboxylase alpha subunit